MTGSRIHNVLIIAYEFPPSAGGGVQRVTKLARYLPESGWQPYVLSATPTWGSATDAGLLGQVSHVKARYLPDRDVAATIARVLSPLKSPLSVPGPDSAGPPEKGVRATAARVPLSARIAKRFFVDSAVLWSRSVPAAALRWSKEIDFEVVFATGPPHSSLVGGARTARLLGLPYVAELRDAWSGNPGYSWPDSSRQMARSRALEREALTAAKAVVTVSAPIARRAEAAGAASTLVVPNGFDPADIPCWNPTDGPLRIAFMGRFYGTTDPTPFLDGMALAIEHGGAAAGLHIDLVGPESQFVRQAVTARGLDAHVTCHGFKPHSDALRIVSHADAGLVVLADDPGAEAIYTSKLFEYLGMGIPVLLVGPENGVAAALVEEAEAGMVVPYGQPDRIATVLEDMAADKLRAVRNHDPKNDVVARYDRRSQAERIARVLDEVASGRGE